MEAMSALTPNTAAFLDSLTMGELDNSVGNNVGLPTSTFFPVPGRDTPEDSSPDSINDMKAKASIVSDDSDQDIPANHKRKAAPQGTEPVDDDDDEDSMSEGGHEDKREKKGRRKSNDKKGDKPPKDNLTKAQRRKEQNRAAQKAFRERREAKVRDLEEKVAELEAKSFGASVENENLRGILRRLQEENMSLKQTHFTFSMPINGVSPTNNAPATGQQTPTQATSGNPIDWSTFGTFKAQNQVPKPPSPPQSVNENLRSINDPSPIHRSSVGSMSDNSPESLVSINGPSPSSSSDRNGMPSLFSGLNSSTPGLNPGLNRNNSTSSPSDILNSTPSSIGGTNKDDVEALFRSLYPNGIDAVLANATNAISYTPAGTTSSTGPQPLQAPVQMPYTFLGSQQGLTSYADSSSNALAKLFGEPTSYRESSTTSAQASLDQSTNSLAGFVNTSSSFSAPQSQMNPVDGPLASQAAWSNMTDNSVNDFLASLSGANNNTDPGDLSATADEDIFSQQIAALLSAQSSSMSPSTAFNLPPNSAFSPTAYLNMSPSPLQSLSNSQTPQSTAGTSSVTSPQTDASSTSGEAPVCGGSDIIHIVGEDGRVMRPSEVWTKMGMHNTSTPGDLLIDDLCDQMKTKATCKDGRRYMNFGDVQNMVKMKEDGNRSRFGDRDPSAEGKQSADDKSHTPVKKESCQDKAYHDPAECQARLNAAYIEANGGL